MGLFDKLFGKKEQKESLDQGLHKTKTGFFEKIDPKASKFLRQLRWQFLHGGNLERQFY